MIEIWKDIIGYEGYYQVSNLGNVRSLDRIIKNKNNKDIIRKGKILKPGVKHSSLFVNLNKNSKMKGYKIHKLVMLMFVGERPKDMHICHNDGNFKNNRLDNLRYDTAKENKKDCYRYSEKPSNAKLTIDNVLKIRKMYHNGYTQKEIAKTFNISRSHVSHIVNGRSFSWIDENGNII